MLVRLILCALLAALLALLPGLAAAEPLTVISALVANGVGLGAAISATLGLGTVGTFAFRLLGSALARAAAEKLFGRDDRVQAERGLEAIRSTPPYRSHYGEKRIVPTYVIGPYKVDGYLYAAVLMNSRPSDSVDDIYLDDRVVPLDTGDATDFSGAGASASEGIFAGHAQFWWGLGDQTAAPDAIVSGSGGQIIATDAWKGRSILWMRLLEGAQDRWLERWPNWPPQVRVAGRWSKVWDLRDETQDPDDPATWTWSNNNALCALDLARHNPIEVWPDVLISLDSFEVGADLADEDFALKAGGTQKRFTVAYTAAFDGADLRTIMRPLAEAGAGRVTLIGGLLTYVPGCWRTPVLTVESVTGDAWEFSRLEPGRDLPTQVSCVHSGNAGSNWEPVALSSLPVPGASGPLRIDRMELAAVDNSIQAQYLQAIRARRLALQKRWTGTLWPEAFDLVEGSTCTLGLPAAYGPVNGTYEVMSTHPVADPRGEGGVALRVPVVLSQHVPEVYDWTPATDERDVLVADFAATDRSIAAPGAITATERVEDRGEGLVTVVDLSAAQSASDRVISYRWEFRVDSGAWQELAIVLAENLGSSDPVTTTVGTLAPLSTYDFRLTALAAGSASVPVLLENYLLSFSLTGVAATVSGVPPESARFTGTAPDRTYLAGVRVFRATVDDFSEASAASAVITVTRGAAFDITVAGLPAGQAFFWLAPVTQSGTDGQAAGSFDLTIAEDTP